MKNLPQKNIINKNFVEILEKISNTETAYLSRIAENCEHVSQMTVYRCVEKLENWNLVKNKGKKLPSDSKISFTNKVNVFDTTGKGEKVLTCSKKILTLLEDGNCE
jgi:DeoR/GlpR family transcriptional regulator of sugar metabolism